MNERPYRGRLAPSPTGLLHLGHARTFWMARRRAIEAKGTLILRNEDLDRDRCKPQFVSAMLKDLKWFGFRWQEGPDCGGPFGPYSQSERIPQYREVLERLKAGGFVYPCTCSRQDVLRALAAPHAGEDEPIYPGTCRPAKEKKEGANEKLEASVTMAERLNKAETRPNWRFHVPTDEVVSFIDGHHGRQEFVAGKDFGDFIVWRHDDIPAYQLAVVVDDAAMQITEVVRGDDLLRSTARQLLLYRALDLRAPAFYHCPLMMDEQGARLAKRHDSLSLRRLREQGATPEDLRTRFARIGADELRR